MQMKRTTPVRMLGLALAAAVVVMGGCREDRSNNPPRQFFPDLDDQLRYQPQSESNFYAEYSDSETGERYGRTMREPVAGTVAFGAEPFAKSVMGVNFSKRADYLREDDAYYRGVNEDGTYVEKIPFRVTEELIDLGQRQYEIYCIVCHGGTGQGDGMVGQQWAYAVPKFTDPKYIPGQSDDPERFRDGFLFHTARNGVPNPGGEYPYKMLGYGSKLSIEETWAIVAWIRTMQRSRNGSLEDLPPAEQRRLRQEAGTPVSASPTEPTNTEEVAS